MFNVNWFMLNLIYVKPQFHWSCRCGRVRHHQAYNKSMGLEKILMELYFFMPMFNSSTGLFYSYLLFQQKLIGKTILSCIFCTWYQTLTIRSKFFLTFSAPKRIFLFKAVFFFLNRFVASCLVSFSFWLVDSHLGLKTIRLPPQVQEAVGNETFLHEICSIDLS